MIKSELQEWSSERRKKREDWPSMEVAFDGNIWNVSESCRGNICTCLCPCDEPPATPQL